MVSFLTRPSPRTGTGERPPRSTSSQPWSARTRRPSGRTLSSPNGVQSAATRSVSHMRATPRSEPGFFSNREISVDPTQLAVSPELDEPLRVRRILRAEPSPFCYRTIGIFFFVVFVLFCLADGAHVHISRYSGGTSSSWAPPSARPSTAASGGRRSTGCRTRSGRTCS